MKVIYKRMGKLKACITETRVYLYIPNENPKICSIRDNALQHSILLKCEDLSKADFEAGINENTVEFAFFKMMYLADIEPIFTKIARLEANPTWDSVSAESPDCPY